MAWEMDAAGWPVAPMVPSSSHSPPLGWFLNVQSARSNAALPPHQPLASSLPPRTHPDLQNRAGAQPGACCPVIVVVGSWRQLPGPKRDPSAGLASEGRPMGECIRGVRELFAAKEASTCLGLGQEPDSPFPKHGGTSCNPGL